jgi:heat shock protein 90kDa beta
VPVEEEKKEEKPAEEEKKEETAEKKEGEEDEEVVATEEETKKEDTESKPKTKKETRTVTNWELVNDQKAIWQRKPSDIKDEEYNSFYKAIATKGSDYSDPLSWIHFNAEGEVEFRSILFIPGSAPHDLYDNYYAKSSSLKLYVRRVLISDEFEELMPRYLNFIKGVVDSDDLPLNVSREQLQQHKILKVMGKKLVRKVLEMIRKLASDQKKALADKEKEEKDKKEGEEDKDEEKKETSTALRKDADTAYDKFWTNFGKNIKLGVIEDSNNRSKLAKLLRFKSSKAGFGKDGKWRSLDDYVASMKKDQKLIYYIAGESYESVSTSPFLERLLQKDLEVLYLTDPIDEYCVQNLPEFDGHRLQSITKEGLQLPGDDNNTAKKREEAYKESFKPLADWLKKVLGDSRVEKVTISNRLNTR